MQVVIESDTAITNCKDMVIEYAFRFKQNSSDEYIYTQKDLDIEPLDNTCRGNLSLAGIKDRLREFLSEPGY